jgi:nucleoside-diphosphate-sugar epimerase
MRDDKRLGECSEREYNDWTAVQDLTGLPSDAFHKNVDDLVLSSGTESVKTAILCPPTIYGAYPSHDTSWQNTDTWQGRGRGPSHTRSRQAYELAHLILTAQYVPIIGQGKARWNNVHVSDLAQLFVLLVEAAVANNTDTQLWKLVDKELEEKEMGKDKAIEQAGFEAVSWGFNSRGKAQRAAEKLGWKAQGKGIEESVEEILKDEKARLDKK